MPPITLTSLPLRATIIPEIGAGIADFSIMGPAKYWHPVMRRAAPGETNSSSLASFFMAPWCNRIAGAKFEFGGRSIALRPNAPTPGAPAQHGDVRARAFRVVSQSADTASLEVDSRTYPDINWPWAFVCRANYRLRPDALRVELSIVNQSQEEMPAGCGHHPYFPRRLWNDADVVELHCPVGARYELKDGVPIGPAAPEALSKRLGTAQPAPAEHIDTVFSGFDAAKGATIRWPASKASLRITASANMGHLVLFCPHSDGTGGTPLPWIAVEPQSQVNGALNNPQWGAATGTVALKPGQALETWTEFAVAAE